LLNETSIRERIPEKLELILVDEFQDTSPIQLAIFSKLAKLVKHSFWVGDEKQAIYGFRGADPELMKGVVHHIDQTSRGREQLEKIVQIPPVFDSIHQ
jgi:ATP-dependent helicase/nuclease subunit A